MSLRVDDFKAKLTGGGARSNLFRATLTYPAFAIGDIELSSFMCKAANLPPSIIAPIAVPFRGRQVQIAGDRTFEPWTVTIINDTNLGLENPVEYKADMIVEQLDKSGIAVKRYDFLGTFPTNISEIAVSYDDESTIEEFTVELQVDFWTSNTTT
jgi:hypothetical protein